MRAFSSTRSRIGPRNSSAVSARRRPHDFARAPTPPTCPSMTALTTAHAHRREYGKRRRFADGIDRIASCAPAQLAFHSAGGAVSGALSPNPSNSWPDPNGKRTALRISAGRSATETRQSGVSLGRHESEHGHVSTIHTDEVWLSNGTDPVACPDLDGNPPTRRRAGRSRPGCRRDRRAGSACLQAQ
jgi:hypothetical protein